MPAQPKHLTVNQAAKQVELSEAALRNWMRQEPTLKKALIKENGRSLFTANAMTILAAIKKRRMANAPPSLKKAWANRKAGKGKRARTSRPKAAASTKTGAAASTGRVSAGRVSAAEAAKQLGIVRVTMYQRMKRRGIKAPGREGFTPEMIATLRTNGKAATNSKKKAPPRNGDAKTLRAVTLRPATARGSSGEASTDTFWRDLAAAGAAFFEKLAAAGERLESTTRDTKPLKLVVEQVH